MQLKIVFVTFVILLWKKIFVLQAFLNINDITYSISIGTLQLFPTPINIFSLDNLAIWINTMFEAKIHHFLCFFMLPMREPAIEILPTCKSRLHNIHVFIFKKELHIRLLELFPKSIKARF